MRIKSRLEISKVGQIKKKEMSSCKKLWFSKLNIFEIRCSRTLICQTMNFVRWNSLSLKNQRFTPSGCKDIGILLLYFCSKNSVLLPKYLEIPPKKTGNFLIWNLGNGKWVLFKSKITSKTKPCTLLVKLTWKKPLTLEGLLGPDPK